MWDFNQACGIWWFMADIAEKIISKQTIISLPEKKIFFQEIMINLDSQRSILPLRIKVK